MQTERLFDRPLTSSTWRITGAASLVALALAGCGTTSDDGVRNVARGKYKPYRPYVVGVPYKIKDIRYFPKENLDYNQTGVASWYGPGFHGKRTANGEEYNQNAMTAAHPTLPMPTIVKVTNLENGRSIVVRINDRGPFADDRIIDLSKEAARRIDMIRHGTARVRVRILRRETLALKDSGRVYADMAALNRRYVDGKGSGTVISSARKDDGGERREDRKSLAARDPKTRSNGGSEASTLSSNIANTADSSAANTGAAGERPLTRAPLRIAPRSYERASTENRASSDDRADRSRRDSADNRADRVADTRSSARDLPRRDKPRARAAAPKRKIVERAIPARRVVKPAPAAGRIYVQAAAYTEKSKARRVRSKLGRLARSRVTAVQISRTIFYRVRLGPVNTTREGDRLLARVVAMGYRNARVVIDPARP